MKIGLTYIRHAPVGGIERFLAGSAAFLRARGHEVTILCRECASPPPAPGVKLVRLGGLGFGSAGHVQAFAKAVERHLARHSYDVVLGLGKTWSQDVLRLGGGLHATFMKQVAPERERRLDRVSLEIEARAMREPRCRTIVANSQMVKREVLATYGLPAEKIEVIHNGVDSARFAPGRHAQAGRALRVQAGFAASDVVFLFLGNGFRRKGLDLALEALAQCGERSARLLVVGDDGERAQFEAQAAALNLAARVRFLGERGDAEVCYAAADVHLLPTRYDPFANTTLEALAAGLPVITSDGNGGSEVLDGASGSIVPLAGAEPALAAAMRRWCDPELRRRGREAALAAAARHPLAEKLAQFERVLVAAATPRA